MADDEFALEGVKELAAEGWSLRGAPGFTDGGYDLSQALTAFAFPSVFALEADDDTASLDANELEAALRADMVKHAWVLAKRSRGLAGQNGQRSKPFPAALGARQVPPAPPAPEPPFRARLADSDSATPAWLLQCHWCGRREFSVGHTPDTPSGWIEHFTRNEGIFLFCSHRCSYDAGEHCDILRSADCPHDKLDHDSACEHCGLVIESDDPPDR